MVTRRAALIALNQRDAMTPEAVANYETRKAAKIRRVIPPSERRRLYLERAGRFEQLRQEGYR
jgi:hypothetical protein